MNKALVLDGFKGLLLLQVPGHQVLTDQYGKIKLQFEKKCPFVYKIKTALCFLKIIQHIKG